MATFKPVYASASTLSATGFNSLANGSAGTSATFNNSDAGNRFMDLFIQTVIVTGGTTTNEGYYEIWIEDSIDGTNWGKRVYLGSVYGATATATTYRSRQLNLGRAYDVLPAYVRVVVINRTGGALASSGHAVNIQGLNIGDA